MDVPSSFFVNREEELQQISDAVKILRNQQLLLRTPIIEYKGVGGIGKTMLLQRIKMICQDQGVVCIMNDAQHITLNDFDAIELRAHKAPLAIILDALENIDNEQLQTIETRLGALIEKTRTFVVLASRTEQRFESTHSIAKKLTLRTLEPLPSASCRQYLDNLPVARATHDIILDWTQGYPLAMKVMTDAIINEGLDPANEQERKQLLGIIIREVIEKNLLVNSNPSRKEQIQTLLKLLSIPRRFNIILMQDLIEKFASEYSEKNSFAYFKLPQFINEPTSSLSWNLERAGYSIDGAVRNLLKRWYKIEQPEEYRLIHQFLAEKNEQYAQDVQKVASLDYVRYLREVLYHLACYEEPTKLQESFTYKIEQLAHIQTQQGKSPLQSPGNFFQFYEEFQQDSEMKEILDASGACNTAFVLSLIYKNFISIYRQLPKNERGEWLKAFFWQVVQKQENDDFAAIFEEGIHQIKKHMAKEDVKSFYVQLIGDRELTTLLGTKIDEAKAFLHAELELLNEG